MEILNKLASLLGIENKDENSVNDAVVSMKLNFENEIKEKDSQIETLKTDVQNAAEKITELETQIEDGKKVNVDALGKIQNKLAEKEAEIVDFKAKYEALEVELNTLKASKTEPINQGDPSLEAGNVQPTKAKQIYKDLMQGNEDLVQIYKKK